MASADTSVFPLMFATWLAVVRHGRRYSDRQDTQDLSEHHDDSQGARERQDNIAYSRLTGELGLKGVDLKVVKHRPFLDQDGHKPTDD